MVSNLVFGTEERIQTEDIREQGAEEDILVQTG
jgi:hypothetical protein